MAITHTVKKGESLTAIAEKYGLISRWDLIYYAPENAAFREKRRNPMLIYPGDILYVPGPPDELPKASHDRRHKYSTKPPAEDLIAKARKLHEEYIELVVAYDEWCADEERATWNYIAGWVEALARDHVLNIDTLVNASAVQTYRQSVIDHKDGKDLRERIESRSKELVDLLQLVSFRHQLAQRDAVTQANIVAEVLEGLGRSFVGRMFLEIQYTTNPTSELSLIGVVFKSAQDAKDAFAVVLTELSPTLAAVKKKGARAAMIALIVVWLKVTEPTGFEKAYPLPGSRHGETIGIIDEAAVKRSIGGAGASDDGKPDYFGKAIAAMNLVITLHDLNHDATLRNKIGAFGAVVEFLDEFKRIASLAGARATALGTRLSWLAFVAGACDTLTGGMDAFDRAKHGDYNAAVMHGIQSLGGAFQAVGAGLFLSGIGAKVGAILFIAGSIMVFVGGFLADLFKNHPLQDWAFTCRFGNGPIAPVGGYNLEEARKQKLRLHRAIVQVNLDVTLRGGDPETRMFLIKLEVKASLLLTISKFTCTGIITWQLFYQQGGPARYIPAPVPLSVPMDMWEKKVVDERIVRLSYEVKSPVGTAGLRPIRDWYFTLTVDVYGDGSLRYTHTHVPGNNDPQIQFL